MARGKVVWLEVGAKWSGGHVFLYWNKKDILHGDFFEMLCPDMFTKVTGMPLPKSGVSRVRITAEMVK